MVVLQDSFCNDKVFDNKQIRNVFGRACKENPYLASRARGENLTRLSDTWGTYPSSSESSESSAMMSSKSSISATRSVAEIEPSHSLSSINLDSSSSSPVSHSRSWSERIRQPDLHRNQKKRNPQEKRVQWNRWILMSDFTQISPSPGKECSWE